MATTQKIAFNEEALIPEMESLCEEAREAYAEERSTEESVLDMLDDCYEPFKLGDITYYPSQILKECDPIALRCMVADKYSNQLSEAEEEIQPEDFRDEALENLNMEYEQ